MIEELSGWIKKNRRAAIVFGVLVLLGTVLAVVLILIQPPDATATAKTYMAATQAQDYEKSYALLSPESQKGVVNAPGMANTSVAAMFAKGLADSYTVGAASVSGDRATVDIVLKKGSTEIPIKLSLVKVAGRWRVET